MCCSERAVTRNCFFLTHHAPVETCQTRHRHIRRYSHSLDTGSVLCSEYFLSLSNHAGVVESYTPQPPSPASSDADTAPDSSANAASLAPSPSGDSSRAPPPPRGVANGVGGQQQQQQQTVRHLPLTVRYENGDGESLDLKSERFTFTAPPRNARVRLVCALSSPPI